MKKLVRLLPLVLLMPLVSFAALVNPGNAGEFDGLRNFFAKLTAFMNGTLVPAVFALAFLVFIWGMFKTFILGGHDEEKQGEGKQLMMYAILGFVIMISLWGIVTIIADSLGLQGGIAPGLLPVAPGPR
jgi:hypothetical protein